MIEYDTFLAPHDGTCQFCADPIKEGQRVKNWDWSSWYHAACIDAHRARQSKAATDRETDALSVLRDLVALEPFMVADGFHEQARQLEAICRRASALVERGQG